MSGRLDCFVSDLQLDKIFNNINVFMLDSSKHEQMKTTGADYSNLNTFVWGKILIWYQEQKRCAWWRFSSCLKIQAASSEISEP